MKTAIEFIKANFVWLVVLILVILLFFSRNPFGCNKPDEDIIRTDTVRVIEQVLQPPVYIPMYVPQQTSSQSPIIIPPQYQSQNNSNDIAEVKRLLQDLANKYYAVNTYNDSIQLKDSSGKRVGVVNIEDKISENSIKSRVPNYQLSFPHTTTTITNTIAAPAKHQFYIGGELTGNRMSPLNGANAGLLWKNKKDQIYGIKAGVQAISGTVQPQFGLSTYWKIKLGK